MAELTLRAATPDDLPDIGAIYNHYVVHSDCTMDTEPRTLEVLQSWFAEHDQLPILVAVRGEEVVGWGSLSPYAARPGYARTLEDSVYVRAGDHRGGVGRRLLSELIARAAERRAHVLVAKIASHQAPSLQLHQSLGFREVGRLREVGWKLGRWIDVSLLQLDLEGGRSL
jgi:phosphinothricin acetyltransferase